MFRTNLVTAMFVSVALSSIACGSDIQMGTDAIGDKVTAAGGGGGASIGSCTAGQGGSAGSGQGGSAGSTELGADWNDLYQHWHRDSAQSTTTTDHFVPYSQQVPLNRFIPAMLFRADGSFEKLMLAPDDAHYYAKGSWTRSGSQLNTIVQDPRLGAVHETFNVQALTPTTLKIAR